MGSCKSVPQNVIRPEPLKTTLSSKNITLIDAQTGKSKSDPIIIEAKKRQIVPKLKPLHQNELFSRRSIKSDGGVMRHSDEFLQVLIDRVPRYRKRSQSFDEIERKEIPIKCDTKL